MPPPKPLSACFMKASRVPPGDQVSAANLSLESSGSLRGFSPLLPTNQISWPWASMQAPTEPSGETEAESQCERRTRGSPPKDGNNPDHGLARLIGDHHRHLFAVGKPFHRPKIGSQLLGQGDVIGFLPYRSPAGAGHRGRNRQGSGHRERDPPPPAGSRMYCASTAAPALAAGG
jgi:hypothetical protein